MNVEDLPDREYVEYSDHLLYAGILLSLGVMMFVVGFGLSLGHLHVIERDGWFTIDANFSQLLMWQLVAVVGVHIAVLSRIPYSISQRMVVD